MVFRMLCKTLLQLSLGPFLRYICANFPKIIHLLGTSAPTSSLLVNLHHSDCLILFDRLVIGASLDLTD